MLIEQCSLKSHPMLKLVVPFCALICASVTFAEDECEPSKWGAEDQIGNLNLISAESVLAAAKLVKEGNVYSLGITIDSTTPAFPPRGMNLYVVQPGQQHEGQPYENMTYNDDIISGWFGIGSQLDGLGHIGDPDGKYYNCNESTEFASITGLTKLGIETVPPMVARGIVLDMAGHFGVDSMEAGQMFTVEDVQAVEEKQGTRIQEGDVVLFHTGWTDAKLEAEPDVWVAAEPGQSEEVASYLVSKNVIAAGADTWGLDVVPPQHENRPFQGHVILLQQNGIFILETMNTGPLVRDGVHEFLFILGQAKVRGAVQMYINPVAIH